MFKNRLVTLLKGIVFVMIVGLSARQAMASPLYTPVKPGLDPSYLRSRTADSARWEAKSAAYAAMQAQAIQRSRAADMARWMAMGNYYTGSQRARAAEAARLTAMGSYYTSQGSQQAWAAEAARLTALSSYYASQGNQQAWAAEAARLTALSNYYAAMGQITGIQTLGSIPPR